MQIWLETTQDGSTFVDDPPGGSDCVPPQIRQSRAHSFVHASESETIGLLLLCQVSPLYIQQCAPERWVVCNPTGRGRIAVLDAQALQIFQHFQHASTLQDLWPVLSAQAPDRVLQAVLLLYHAGLLQSPDLPVQQCNDEEDAVLNVWLHITNACNLRCTYCYLEKTPEHMQEDTAFRAVDAVFRSALTHHYTHVRLKYAGGEASLHMNRVLAVHTYALRVAQKYNMTVSASLLCNGVALSQRAIEGLKTCHIRVTISLDGVGTYHDRQRPFLQGQSSFTYVDATIRRLLTAQWAPHISVTVSLQNLDGIAELLQYLLELALPFTLNYYRDNDYAVRRHELQFGELEMIHTMRNAFKVLERNLPARSLLSSLIDKANLLGPHQQTCGVGRNYLVIDQQGRIAKCHSDIKRTLTTIAVSDPLQIIRQDRTGIQNLSVDAKQGCQTCNWRYWCTGGCPLLTYRVTGRYDLQSPNCHIYQALFPEVMRLEALRLLKYVPACLP
jgi:uncharacterized protein